MGFNMKDLQKMQAKLMKMQEDLQNSTFEGSSGGDAVTVTINGKYEVTAVKLDKEVVDPEDISMLEDLIAAALHIALPVGRRIVQWTGGIKQHPRL